MSGPQAGGLEHLPVTDPPTVFARLLNIERALVRRADDLAVFLAFDRPQRLHDRPELARTFFAQRCVSDADLSRIISSFREVGAYVELFEGELPFLAALADGRIRSMRQPLKVVYNEIEGGITKGGFEPGRKALVPSVADAYGLMCANSNAYACALGRHKFHYSTILTHLGVRTPRTWHYRSRRGWVGDLRPPQGLKVIAKSTYENWSVGVTDASVFHVDEGSDDIAAGIADQIGQPVTVQEFVSGAEVGVTVFACPDLVIPPPVKTTLTKAPGDPDAVMTIDDNLGDQQVLMEGYEGPTDVMRELYAASARAFEGLELGAFARFDFKVDTQGRSWLTDVGVSPGISEKDAAFRSLALLGFDHPTFLRVVLSATLAAHGHLN